MSRLELSRFWQQKLDQALPDSSKRIRTKLAWHLAALGVFGDEQLAEITDDRFATPYGNIAPLRDMAKAYIGKHALGQSAR